MVTVTAKKAVEGWWDKVTSGPKQHNVKIDWASWKDEDEGTSLIAPPLLLFFTRVTVPRRSSSLKLSDTRVYEPQIRAPTSQPRGLELPSKHLRNPTKRP